MYRNKYRLIIPFLIPSVGLYLWLVIFPYIRAMYDQPDALEGPLQGPGLHRSGKLPAHVAG